MQRRGEKAKEEEPEGKVEQGLDPCPVPSLLEGRLRVTGRGPGVRKGVEVAEAQPTLVVVCACQVCGLRGGSSP